MGTGQEGIPVSVRNRDHAQELMQNAIDTGDTSILAIHLRRLSSDATQRAFAIMLGYAGCDISIEERFMGVMMANRLLTVEDIAGFAKQMRKAARDAELQGSTRMGHEVDLDVHPGTDILSNPMVVSADRGKQVAWCDRRAVRAEEMPEDMLELIAVAEVLTRYVYLDAEVRDWKPSGNVSVRFKAKHGVTGHGGHTAAAHHQRPTPGGGALGGLHDLAAGQAIPAHAARSLVCNAGLCSEACWGAHV